MQIISQSKYRFNLRGPSLLSTALKPSPIVPKEVSYDAMMLVHLSARSSQLEMQITENYLPGLNVSLYEATWL